MSNTQTLILGQDVSLSFNSKEPKLFKVIYTNGDLVRLIAHKIGEDGIYDITMKLIPPMPPEGMSEPNEN
jgi:hypothetical protein